MVLVITGEGATSAIATRVPTPGPVDHEHLGTILSKNYLDYPPFWRNRADSPPGLPTLPYTITVLYRFHLSTTIPQVGLL